MAAENRKPLNTVKQPNSVSTRTRLESPATPPTPIKRVKNAWSFSQDQLDVLWGLAYQVDTVRRCLEHSKRIDMCECDTECFRDIEGPKRLLSDAAETFHQLLVDIESGTAATSSGSVGWIVVDWHPDLFEYPSEGGAA